MKIKIICSLLLFTIFISPVNAYTFPDNACYISANISYYGNVDIYIPCSQTSNLTLYNGTPINIGNSQITGYFNYNNDEATIRFPIFNTPNVYYNRDYRDVTFNSISNSNIKWQDQSSIAIDQYWIYICSGFMAIVIFVQLYQIITGRH